MVASAKIAFDDLEIVAVQASRPAEMPWRPLHPVFRFRNEPERVVWPTRVRQDGVFGDETPLSYLEHALEEKSATMLSEPLRVLGDHRIVATSAGLSYVHRDTIRAWKTKELSARLAGALALLDSNGDLEELEDAFDGAFLVDRWSLVAATLRAGSAALRREDDPDWFETALGDLERCEEFCAPIDTVLSHPLTAKLPARLVGELFRHASSALAERRGSRSMDWEWPVEERHLLEAAAFARFHEEYPEHTGRFAHALIRDALRGAPYALEAIGPTLRAEHGWPSPWSTWSEADPAWKHDPNRALAVAMASAVDRYRFAQNLYRLELGADEKDRGSIWRSFLRRSRGFSRFQKMAPWQEGEELAIALREELAIEREIVSMKHLVGSDVGVFVGVMEIPVPLTLAAASAPVAAPPCIFANATTRTSGHRRLLNRFSIAHELAHLVLDRHGSHDWSCVLWLDDEAPAARDDSERRANAFASYFIAPREEVCSQIPRPSGDASSDAFIQSALALRNAFGLSIVAAGEHLANCYDGLRRKMGPLPWAVRHRLWKAAEDSPVTGFEGDEELDPKFAAGPRLYSGRYAKLIDWLRRAAVLDEDTATALIPERRPW